MFAVFETRINCERLLDMSSFKNITKKEKKKKRILQFALRVENVFFFSTVEFKWSHMVKCRKQYFTILCVKNYCQTQILLRVTEMLKQNAPFI